MAIDFDNLFENVGEYVDRVNEYAAMNATHATGLSEIEAELVANAMYNVLEGEFTRINRYRQDILSWIDDSRSKIIELFLDKATIRDELNLGDVNDFATVYQDFYDAMVDATESIVRSTVSFGSVTVSAINGATVGSATTNKRLDGYNPPHTDYPIVRGYVGVDSELALTDEMALVCIADSETDGVETGFEVFQWVGRPSAGNNYSWETYGSGTGPTISPIQSGGLMTNLEFQDFTSDVPDGWTADTGTAGTHISDSAAEFLRGAYSLELAGDGAIVEIKLSQAAPTLIPLRRYAVGFWIKGNASQSNGVLTIEFEGTGYTAAAEEQIALDNSELTAMTTWEWHQLWITMPAEIPDDFTLTIKFNDTPTDSEPLWINGGGMQEVTYFNGHAATIHAGADAFLRSDTITYTVTNNYAGVFQTALAKLLGVQVPSHATTPTIPDSLAT